MNTHVTPIALLLFATTFAACTTDDTTTQAPATEASEPLTATYMACDPTASHGVHKGVEATQMTEQPLWMAHDSNAAEVQGLILLFHGGGETAESWFEHASRASFVASAVEQGYAVAALDQQAAQGFQWSVHDALLDLEGEGVITANTPLYGVGHGEGGFYVSALTQTVGLNALVLSGSEGATGIIRSETARPHPPTLFSLGANDPTVSLKTATDNAIAINDKGAHVQFMVRESAPITPTALTQAPGVDCQLAQDFVVRLAEAHMLNPDGTLSDAPENLDWYSALADVEPLDMTSPTDRALVASLEQRLAELYAGSSFAVDNDAVLGFLNTH